MPHSADPVLSLALDNISKIDKVDCDRLSSLWTVFTKCAENLENGRRLENLSWRLWYRECQLTARDRRVAEEANLPHIQTRSSIDPTTFQEPKLPPLSSSVESAISEEEGYLSGEAQGLQTSNNTKGQHLTPDRFHELVALFGQEPPQYAEWREVINDQTCTGSEAQDTAESACDLKQMDNVTPTCSAPSSIVPSNLPTRLCTSKSGTWRNAATETAPSDPVHGLRRASSVVHGFNPSCVSTKKSPLAWQNEMILTNDSKTSDAAKGNMFFIESSPSESEVDEDAFPKKSRKKATFRPPCSYSQKYNTFKPTTTQARAPSFREIIAQASQEYDSSPFDSDSESDKPTGREDESAILSDDEGDDGDWDSVGTESRNNSPPNGPIFNKMEDLEQRPLLTSRKSILSTLLTNPMTRISNGHSRSSPVISRSRRMSLVEAGKPSTTELGEASKPEQVSTTPTSAQATNIKGSVSPRTTRRNMLATELSESLRKHLLWERKQKNPSSAITQAPNGLQRRHTTFDLTKMKEFPKPATSCGESNNDMYADNEFGYNGAGW